MLLKLRIHDIHKKKQHSLIQYVLIQRLTPNRAMQQSPDPATQPGYARTCVSLQCSWWQMLVSLLKFFAVSVGKCRARRVALVQRGSIDSSI